MCPIHCRQKFCRYCKVSQHITTGLFLWCPRKARTWFRNGWQCTYIRVTLYTKPWLKSKSCIVSPLVASTLSFKCWYSGTLNFAGNPLVIHYAKGGSKSNPDITSGKGVVQGIQLLKSVHNRAKRERAPELWVEDPPPVVPTHYECLSWRNQKWHFVSPALGSRGKDSFSRNFQKGSTFQKLMIYIYLIMWWEPLTGTVCSLVNEILCGKYYVWSILFFSE